MVKHGLNTMFYIGNNKGMERRILRIYVVALVLLVVTIAAMAGPFNTIAGLPIQTVERGSSNTNSHPSRITLTLSQSNITIVRGSPAQIDIQVGLTPSGSFRASLSAQQVPLGITVSFNPTSARSSFVSTMTIIASNSSSLGHFDLAVVATGGSATKVRALSVLEAALVHDLAVIDAASPKTATIGKLVTVNATVANYGSVPENYIINLYANITLVAAEPSTTLLPFVQRPTTLSWNTTGFVAGEYSLTVAIPPVPGESDIMNNHFQVGNILLVQAPTGNPTPNPSAGNPQPVSENWRELAIAVAIVWMIVVALVFFRGTLRRAVRRVNA